MIHVGGDDEQKKGGGGGRGGDRGLGEVRKIHIVYFLTRKGRTEQPHLIRVYHRHRNGGVRLRDVKRWLSQMRGKDMVDSYAWSYKRRYRTGYVWQDLTDDELITPLNDNEYILKGSNISCFPELPSVALSISHTTHPFLCTEEKNLQQENGDDEKPDPKSNLSSPHRLPDIPEDLESSSPETRHPPSSLVNASTQTEPEEEEGEQEKNENGSGNVPSLGKSKTCRGGGRGILTAHLFRNLITCGGAETLDSVMMPINLRRRSGVEENGGKGFGYRRIPIHRSSTPPENPRRSFGGKSTTAEGEVERVTEPRCWTWRRKRRLGLISNGVYKLPARIASVLTSVM